MQVLEGVFDFVFFWREDKSQIIKKKASPRVWFWMDSENSENKQGSKKKELNLMPPALPAPPLEKETYIPPNQLELEWEMSPCSRVTT